jgi:hypothetical protein
MQSPVSIDNYQNLIIFIFWCAICSRLIYLGYAVVNVHLCITKESSWDFEDFGSYLDTEDGEMRTGGITNKEPADEDASKANSLYISYTVAQD